MSIIKDKITEESRTQVMAKGINLNDLIKEDVLAEIKEKFASQGEVATSIIQFHILEENKESIKVNPTGKKLLINLSELDFIQLNHPSPEHYKNKIVVITSNKNKTLEEFLK